MYAGARDSLTRRISNPLFSQMASETGASSNSLQPFGHTIGRFRFTDKRIRAGRKCGLLTGVQMADKDNDQRGRTGSAEFIQC
jgi:hypothetical protein